MISLLQNNVSLANGDKVRVGSKIRSTGRPGGTFWIITKIDQGLKQIHLDEHDPKASKVRRGLIGMLEANWWYVSND